MLTEATGADADCAGFDEGQGVGQGADAAGGLDPAARGRLGHEADVFDAGAAGLVEAGAGLEEVDADVLGDAADETDLVACQGGRLDDDLQDDMRTQGPADVEGLGELAGQVHRVA
jgi:hypothetical protein